MDARQEANALSGTTLEKLVATDASVLVSSNVVGVEVEAGVRDASLPRVEHAVRESDRTTVIANVQARTPRFICHRLIVICEGPCESVTGPEPEDHSS